MDCHISLWQDMQCILGVYIMHHTNDLSQETIMLHCRSDVPCNCDMLHLTVTCSTVRWRPWPQCLSKLQCSSLAQYRNCLFIILQTVSTNSVFNFFMTKIQDKCEKSVRLFIHFMRGIFAQQMGCYDIIPILWSKKVNVNVKFYTLV